MKLNFNPLLLSYHGDLDWEGDELERRVVYEEKIRIQVELDADIYHDAYVTAKTGADAELDPIHEGKRR